MGGSSGGTTVQAVQAPAAPTAGQSAAEYAAALPKILQAQLQYQPQFNQADYESFAKLAPMYTAVYDQINKQYYPNTYGLQEQLASQAAQGSTAELPSWMKKQYQDQFNAQLGTNVNSPIGADYVSRGLIGQAEQYRNYYQNLGLSVAGRQPLTTAQYQSPSFNVADQFGQNYNTVMGGYGSYAAASRPTTIQKGTPNWIPALQAGGSLLSSVGSLAAMCWVASACFGGWHQPNTIYARYYVRNYTPNWFKKLYIQYGESISKNKLLVSLLKPLFNMFATKGKRLLYGS